jgi:hypothetical protein
MKRKIESEDVFFAVAAVIGVGTIVLFSIVTIAKWVIHLIK